MQPHLPAPRQGRRGRLAETPDARLEVAEITDPAALEALRPQWWRLFDACPDASPFQSPEWLLAWRRHFLARGLWTLAVRRDDGRLIGLAPFFIHAEPATGRRQLTLLGNGVSDRLDLLAAPADRDAVARAVFARLAERAGLWTDCDFRDLPADSPLLAEPLPLAAAAERVDAEEPCPALALPDRPDEVLAGLSKARRGDIRRCARRLAETGALAFEAADAANCAEHLAALGQLHGARRRLRGGAGVLADPPTRAFLDDASAGLLARGLLRLEALRLGGRIIAVQFALRRGTRGYSWLHAFDPEFAAHGPGWILLARSLEAAVDAGVRSFDFLRGREAYKYEWGAADQPQFRRRIAR